MSLVVPYIGITDFVNFQQVQDMLEVFRVNRKIGSQRCLHVGVMMSHGTLHDMPSKWKNVFPPKESIAEIFQSEAVYNCLHYADFRDYPEFTYSLPKAIAYAGSGIHAVQLDMTWPLPVGIAQALQMSRKKVEVILQIGQRAFEVVKNDPEQLVAKLARYQGVIHRVLLDKSMGHGIAMNGESLLPFLRAISESFPNLGLVVAGGLGPQTLHLMEPIIQEFPDISIDAQGKLRPSGSCMDPIVWDLARLYLIGALKLMN